MVLPLPRILVAVFTRLPCVVTVLPLPPMFVAKFAYGAICRDGVAVAKEAGGQVEDRPRACGGGGVRPTTKAAPNNPSAWASAPSPIAMATLNNVLVQSALLPIPKNDAQVAFAVGADPNPALANNPLATAPATRAPAILRGEFTMLSAINCCSNHDKNASIPLVTMSRYMTR